MQTVEVKPRDEAASLRFLKLPKQLQKELIDVQFFIQVALDESSFACDPNLTDERKIVVGCVDTRLVLARLLKARSVIEKVTGSGRRSTIHGWDWPEPK